MSEKKVAAKTIYNRSTDGWEVIVNGAKVDGRAAIMDLAAGTAVTLRRGPENELVSVSGERESTPAGDAVALVLDGLVSLRGEDRKVAEFVMRSWERGANAADKQAAQSQALADTAVRVAENVAALNDSLCRNLAAVAGENMVLKSTLSNLVGPNAGNDEHWVDKLLKHAPQIAATVKMFSEPLPPADEPKEGKP